MNSRDKEILELHLAGRNGRDIGRLFGITNARVTQIVRKAWGTGAQPLKHRMNRFAVKGDGCWEWTGARGPNGYGRVTHGYKHLYAHRAAWMVAHGPIPEGKYVCHSCDNRNCVRPDHLFLGSHADNMGDASQKGRLAQKLTEQAVGVIRRRYAAGGISQAALGVEFGVSQTTIGKIVAGRTWRHAPFCN